MGIQFFPNATAKPLPQFVRLASPHLPPVETLKFKVSNTSDMQGMGFLSVATKSDNQNDGLNFFRYAGTGVTLFTREGVALLATIVTTDKAWALRQTFIDAYFTLEGLSRGTLSNLEAAAKAREVVSTGSMLLGRHSLLDGVQLGRATPEELAKAYAGKGKACDSGSKVSKLTQMVDTNEPFFMSIGARNYPPISLPYRHGSLRCAP